MIELEVNVLLEVSILIHKHSYTIWIETVFNQGINRIKCATYKEKRCGLQSKGKTLICGVQYVDPRAC